LPLELRGPGFYVRGMRCTKFFLAAALLTAPAALRAQDAAVEERLNKLSARIDDLVAAKDLQNRRLDELARAVRDLQDQLNKPTGNYAAQEDLKRLADNIGKLDQRQREDMETVAKEFEKLGKVIKSSAPARSTSPGPATPTSRGTGEGATPPRPEKGYEHVIKENDTLSAIARAYNEQGIKVTVQQILDANPGLKPENLKPGKKIFIPAPTP
jgi:LysM repeat protein